MHLLKFQVCKFRAGSYSHNINLMTFKTHFDRHIIGDVVLDYAVEIHPLQEEDERLSYLKRLTTPLQTLEHLGPSSKYRLCM